MDLFASAGMELPRSGPSGRRPIAPRSLHVPLFAYKVVEAARARAAFAPSEDQRKLAANYARKAKKAFGKQNESAVRATLVAEVLVGLLGYTRIDPESEYTLAEERQVGRGAVDVALGRFDDAAGRADIVAPFELKGPKTHDLDAPMPGRGRSPVQQAWEYAIDAPGAHWVLVSNCLEIRLYAFGRGRDAYEVFDLTRLDEAEEHARLWLLLSAQRTLGGGLDALLRETDSAYRDITDALYKQYKDLREDLMGFLVHSADGPKLPALDAIEPAQKILDRILFIAFAQRTDLLPDRLLELAAEARNDFAPRPRWDNFIALFRAVDRGNPNLNVWPYNGGLFAEDPVADKVVLPDHLAAKVADLGKWDYRSEVPVTLLGHIFEQSITDIERLKAEATGTAPPAVSKRKREGVVYTPDMVTRFLVDKTIGVTLEEAFRAAETRHGMGERASEAAQIAFWRDYLGTLRALRIVDPACGSGAFLVAAYDALVFEYRRAAKALAALGETIEFDIADEIVTRNLYGVDLNPESVEITRLSLWLKTARRDHRLQNLESTIRIGDSLIEDTAYTAHPFDWRAAFPEVFERGGFDVVIGNPPYVRMELIKAVKPYLSERYRVASDRADLYAYFYERGVRLLKDGGRLGFISSSTFFRTGSGEPLRQLLSETTCVETLVDFGDAQLFAGVTTYPAIVALRKSAPTDEGRIDYLVVDGEPPADLSRAFRETARAMPLSRLGAGSWRVEDAGLAKLRDKIARGRKTLGEVFGAPLYGIKTGLNDAFVIDTPTRDRLVKTDAKSAELLKPFLCGENVKRWRVEPEGLWLINTPKGKVDIDAYPAVRDWLLPFKPELEKRATKQEWFELQQAQLVYQPKFEMPKIVYLDIADTAPFAVERDGRFIDCTVFMIQATTEWLAAFLNSKAAWFQWVGLTPIASGGFIRLKAQYIAVTVLPEPTGDQSGHLAALGQTCTDAAQKRFAIQSAVRRRILDLAPPGRAKLTGKLHDWHELEFPAFRAEIKRTFRADIPVKERGEWEAYLDENRAQTKALSATIASAEREIDAIVYALFDLTADEIARLEASLEGQY